MNDLKKVKLTMSRFGSRLVFNHRTVKEAAYDACSDIESNEACPISIEEDGVLIWEMVYPLEDSYRKVYGLAGWNDE